MSELPPSPNELDTSVIAGKSLRQWHEWLCLHPETGRDQSHLMTPGSRYGRYTTETAWYALAGAVVYMAEASTEYDDQEFSMTISLGAYMNMAVNDNPDVAEMILYGWEGLPQALRDVLGGEDTVRGMID